MTNHPGRKPGPRAPAVVTPSLPLGAQPATPDVLIDLQGRAGLTDAQMASLCRAGVQTWRNWRRDPADPCHRQIPLASMELLCLALMVGSTESGPYVAPGDWCLPYLRREFALWFRRAPARRT